MVKEDRICKIEYQKLSGKSKATWIDYQRKLIEYRAIWRIWKHHDLTQEKIGEVYEKSQSRISQIIKEIKEGKYDFSKITLTLEDLED